MKGQREMTGTELVALVCGILGFAFGAFMGVVFYAHALASSRNL